MTFLIPCISMPPLTPRRRAHQSAPTTENETFKLALALSLSEDTSCSTSLRPIPTANPENKFTSAPPQIPISSMPDTTLDFSADAFNLAHYTVTTPLSTPLLVLTPVESLSGPDLSSFMAPEFGHITESEIGSLPSPYTNGSPSSFRTADEHSGVNSLEPEAYIESLFETQSQSNTSTEGLSRSVRDVGATVEAYMDSSLIASSESCYSTESASWDRVDPNLAGVRDSEKLPTLVSESQVPLNPFVGHKEVGKGRAKVMRARFAKVFAKGARA